MLNKLKDIVRPFVPRIILYEIGELKAAGRRYGISFLAACLKIKHVWPAAGLRAEDCYVVQFKKMLKRMKPRIIEGFFYPYDPYLVRLIPEGKTILASITADFSVILRSDLRILKNQFDECSDRKFAARQVLMISLIEKFMYMHRKEIKYRNMLYEKPSSLEEAVQKLLFYDGLFWQVNHRHIGLGRLDVVLNEYFSNAEEDKGIILRLCRVLGYDTKSKSMSLPGDTGQYILLGGCDKEGNCVETSLTMCFLEVFTDNKFIDPKLILRVGGNTSDEI